MFNVLQRRLLHLVFPWVCAHCRRVLPDLEDPGYCAACWLTLPRIDGLVCHQCGLPLPEGGTHCWDCRKSPSRLKVRAASLYAGSLRSGLLRFKFANRVTLAPWFGILMAQAWHRSPELHATEALVPVPLHPRRERDRGYNQAVLLATELGPRIGRPVFTTCLRRTRATRPQAELNQSDRLRNLTGSFQSMTSSTLRGRSLLLIDDVSTTQTTLRECASVLRRAGAAKVAALVLARDPR